VTMAIEYTAKDVTAGAGAGVSGDLVAPGAVVDGTVSETGDITVVDCGVARVIVTAGFVTESVRAPILIR